VVYFNLTVKIIIGILIYSLLIVMTEDYLEALK